MEWKVKIGDEEFTAGSTEKLQEWYADRRLKPDSYVFHPLLEKWVYASEVQELKSVVRADVQAAADKGRLTASCPNCGYQGEATTEYRGSGAFGCLLMLLFILPGLIYLAWRSSTAYARCPQCGAENITIISGKIGQTTTETKWAALIIVGALLAFVVVLVIVGANS
jgi:predicted RNA-binding Zn-ribbon protein involved in translation (DUF1610 family)